MELGGGVRACHGNEYFGCRGLEVRLAVWGESYVETEHDVVGVCVIEV